MVMNINKCKILEIVYGSELYGTSTPDSDKNFVGIFIKPEEFMFGLNNIEYLDCSVKSKNPNEKKDSVGRHYCEIGKFFDKALKGNPNYLEMFFVNDDNTVYINKFGRIILDNAHLFVSKRIKEKFLSYAIIQKQKMLADINGKNRDKYAAHCLRLLFEGIELAETGRLSFPLREKDIVLDTKLGLFTKEESIAAIEDVEEQLEEAFKSTTLPEKPDFNAVNNLLIKIREEYYGLAA